MTTTLIISLLILSGALYMLWITVKSIKSQSHEPNENNNIPLKHYDYRENGYLHERYWNICLAVTLGVVVWAVCFGK